MPEPVENLPFTADSPAVTTHINVLQGIINRLAGNSASCKTWCLTIVGALLSVAAAAHLPTLVGCTVIPVIALGFLDAMYLAQEKAYRDLFGVIVASIRNGTYDRSKVFDAKATITRTHFAGALMSWSIWPLYLGLIVLYAIAAWSGLVTKFAFAGK